MVPTKSIGAELDRRKFRNVKIWTRGVDREQFRDYPRDHLDLPRPIVLYAGRLAIEKGIDDFMALKVKGSKVLVGDGPERERLERLNPSAHFLGFRHGEDYARTLASADVMVFPSRTDTFGLVMLEAMACGTPVAAYNAPSPLDVVEDGVTGCIADSSKRRSNARSSLTAGRSARARGISRGRSAPACSKSWLVPCGSIPRQKDRWPLANTPFTCAEPRKGRGAAWGSGRQGSIQQSVHTPPASWLSAQASMNFTPRAPSSAPVSSSRPAGSSIPSRRAAMAMASSV